MADDNTPELPLDTTTEAPAPETTAETTAAPETVETKPAPKPETDWREKQIDRQHRKIKELEAAARRAEELAAENERLRQLAEAATSRRETTAEPQTQQPPVQRTVQAEPPKNQASLEAEWRFKKDIEDLGVKLSTGEYADQWKVAQENFRKMGEIEPAFMQDVLATDDPAYVLVELGKNPEKYQQILDLPANRRQGQLHRLAFEKGQQAKPAPKPSTAPAPIEPLRAGPSATPPGKVDIYDPKLSGEDYDNAWYAERMRQKRESQGRVWSISGRAGR
jgi:hypothetical protein